MTQVPPASAHGPSASARVHSAAREITVGQLAARSGATVSALHFYEAQGLISARGCGCLSLTDCQLANPDDTLGASGTGPRRLSGQYRSGQYRSGQAGHGQGGGQQDDGP
jgi:hypothetical protein